MPIFQGPLEWDSEHGSPPWHLGGVPLVHRPGFPSRSSEGVEPLVMMDGSTVTQTVHHYRDAPESIGRLTASIEVSVGSESDARALERLRGSARPRLLYLGSWWVADLWDVAVGGAGRTSWLTSRRGHWDVPGIDVAAYSPQLVAEIDGVAATITTSAPGAGEVQIGEANDGPASASMRITTQDLHAAGAAELMLYYPAELWVRVIDAEAAFEDDGSYLVSLELAEHLPARYEAAII